MCEPRNAARGAEKVHRMQWNASAEMYFVFWHLRSRSPTEATSTAWNGPARARRCFAYLLSRNTHNDPLANKMLMVRASAANESAAIKCVIELESAARAQCRDRHPSILVDAIAEKRGGEREEGKPPSHQHHSANDAANASKSAPHHQPSAAQLNISNNCLHTFGNYPE